ncbi:MAG: SCO family protein [Alphaproteobacteria bacterium]|nr:SCO family protein [Alphaproteobacteria bacterium]MBU6473080.1 SCO family protein [Alphaproteobacteria bacterium]MDE2012249.1 SCO family protein [Alphaproteobacteria bacterium]MDE2074456.1 SCO family protein [Alphaproteobacteria bacterium]MDE2352712.1 SCO family protein [Alphaproteobacteria bacterium]
MRRPVVVTLVALVIAAAIGVVVWEGGHIQRQQGQVVEGTASDIGGPFTLTDQYGRTRRDSEFRGRYMLVYFGYTNCPDVCPTTLSVMADALDKMEGAAKQVVPIFITVDPARDTPSVMKQYLSSFGPDFIGLTGPADAIAKVAKAYHVYEKDEPAKNGTYAVDHSNAMYLMGPDGKFVTSYTETMGPDKLAEAIMQRM